MPPRHDDQWLMFQMESIGPFFGQVSFFHKFSGKTTKTKRPRDRYAAESNGCSRCSIASSPGERIVGEHYTIADIATFPWVNNLVSFYGGALIRRVWNVKRALHALRATGGRAGLNIPSRP
jgi:GST-like protein